MNELHTIQLLSYLLKRYSNLELYVKDDGFLIQDFSPLNKNQPSVAAYLEKDETKKDAYELIIINNKDINLYDLDDSELMLFLYLNELETFRGSLKNVLDNFDNWLKNNE